MDPNTALRNALTASSPEAFTEACEALAGWLRAGGFRPSMAAVADVLRYYPGTGTPWRVLSPAGDNDNRWELVRYNTHTGARVEAFGLFGAA
jgi:hypothetical protein